MEHENKKMEEQALVEATKTEIGKIFDSNNDSAQRADALVEKVQPALTVYSELGLISEADITEVLSELRECTNTLERDEFISRVADLIRPLLEIRLSHAPEIEKVQRKLFVENSDFLSLNEILFYGTDQGVVHIHLAPAKTLSFNERKRLVNEGLEKLAHIVREDENIKEIVATSWIIAQAPEIIEKLGFTVKGEIDPETKAKHFVDEDRPVGKAVMSREEFIAKYD